VREKPIKDIRYFECEALPAWNGPSAAHLGRLYPLTDRGEMGALGSRFSLKLRERGFLTRGYDHVYVTLTPALPEGKAEKSAIQLEPWHVWVNVGEPLESWPGEPAEQYAALLRLTSAALRCLGEEDNLDCSLVPSVEAEVLQAGSNLELVRTSKETEAYRVVVSYQVAPFGTPSPIFVEYDDRRTGRSGKALMMMLSDFEDVFPLASSVSVARGTITLKARDSERANLTTRRYRLPLQISVDEVLNGAQDDGR